MFFFFFFPLNYVQALDLTEEQLKNRIVDFIDIAYDEVNPKHYKEEEVVKRKSSFFGYIFHLLLFLLFFQDLRFFKSKKTDRGPLPEDWQKNVNPIMCSYKVVEASFEVWGMQSKCEDLIQRVC